MKSLILSIFTLLIFGSGGGESATKLDVGDMAPTFQTQRVDGATARFPAPHAGNAVATGFWGNRVSSAKAR